MVTLSLTRLASAVGGMALSLTAGAGVVSADPDLGPVVNTTCNYSQVVAAMNTEFPPAAAQFNANPLAQFWLQNFLASPPEQRQQLLQEAKSTPEAAQFVGLFAPVANTCTNY
ncbi:MAG: hemophore-related protein [Mycobacterium sp.]|nr:hemophore-related protein [Mycobacterium sp.]